jgi:hypothetical protein
MKPFLPAAAALAAFALAACQDRSPDQAAVEAPHVESAVAVTVDAAKAPAFAAAADPHTDPNAAAALAPRNVLGEDSDKGHSFDVTPTTGE